MSSPNREPRPGHRLLFGGRPSAWSLLVPVTFFLAGLLFATSAGTARGHDLRGSDSQDLADLVRTRSRVIEERQDAVTRLEAQVKALTAQSGPYRAQLEPLDRRIQALSGPAGLTAVEGPALQVSLDDSDRPLSSFDGEFTADDLVIHQQDVQAFANAMWRGGAEAMMIMDQRVTATSAVRCVGNTLILGGRVYSPPFTVRAIGDVARMRAAIDADDTISVFKGYVEAAGVRYEIKDLGEQRFPAADAPAGGARVAKVRG